ncbi:MAG: hypothetical protein ACOCXA_10035, partial [Planctomycetota bacterium]
PDLSAERPDKGEGNRAWFISYNQLRDQIWWISGHEKSRKNKPNPHASSDRSTPGELGAIVSPLYGLLTEGSHADKVQLTAEERRILWLWMDLNSQFYGVDNDIGDQIEGQLVKPALQ